MGVHPTLATRPVVVPPPRRHTTVGASAAADRPRRTRGMRRLWRHHGLSLTLFGLSFLLHAVGGVRHYNAEQLTHGEAPITLPQYLGTSAFWFESLQNWQSEFLALGVMLVLSIVLRQQGSPASKPVAAPHYETGHR